MEGSLHSRIENQLKSLYFLIVDINEDQLDNLYHLSKEEPRDQEKEKQQIKTILETELYYELVASFAKTWGSAESNSEEIPEELLAGSALVCEFLKKDIPDLLQKEVSKEVKNSIVKQFGLDQGIPQEKIEEYHSAFLNKKQERTSDIDKEENWDNLSNAGGENDVVYLNEQNRDMFDIDGMEDEGEEFEMPEQNNEEESDEEFEQNKNKDKEDFSEFQLKAHTSFVTRVNIDSKGKYLISGGGDDLAIIWDLEKREVLQKLPKKNETVDSASFNFDGSLIGTATLDGEVDVYKFDGKQAEALSKAEGLGEKEEITFLEFHMKGNALITGGADGTLYMLNAKKGELMNSFYGHEDMITMGRFTPDGQQILTCSVDQSVRTWNPKTGQQIHKINGYGFHEDAVNIVAFHKNNSIIATGSEDKTVCISNYQTGKVIGRTTQHEGIVESILFTQQLDLFISGSSDGICRIYDLSKISIRDKVQLQGNITKIYERKKNCQIVASTSEGRLYMFDYRKPQEVFVQKGLGETIHDFVVDQEDEGCYAACEDGAIRYFSFSKFAL